MSGKSNIVIVQLWRPPLPTIWLQLDIMQSARATTSHVVITHKAGNIGNGNSITHIQLNKSIKLNVCSA